MSIITSCFAVSSLRTPTMLAMFAAPSSTSATILPSPDKSRRQVYEVSESVWLYRAHQIRNKKLNLKQDQGNMIKLDTTDPHSEMTRYGRSGRQLSYQELSPGPGPGSKGSVLGCLTL